MTRQASHVVNMFSLVHLLLITIIPFSQSLLSKTDIYNQEHHDKNNTVIFQGDIRATWGTISLRYSPEFALKLGLSPPEPACASCQDGTQAPEWIDYFWYNDWRRNLEIWRVDVFLSPGVFNAQETRIIKRSLANLYRLTGVIRAKFVSQRPSDSYYIEIIKGGGCWSYVGRQPDRFGQELSLDDGCVYRDTVQHEFLHALGFEHEQSRPDRDDYVTILYDNIIPGREHNFDKSSYVDSLGSPYDYKSVMHYHEYAFTVNGEKTIDTRGDELTTKDRVSAQDRIQVSRTALIYVLSVIIIRLLYPLFHFNHQYFKF
jgi:Astacin (Peptidase family M12A).